MQWKELEGKKALVTGSTQGIGRALALALASCGARVTVHGASSREKAMAVAEEITAAGGEASCAIADLRRLDCAATLFQQTGPVDILILNASVQYRREWACISQEEFEAQMQVNVHATLQLMQAYVPGMKQKGWGRILTIGSVQQYRPHEQMLIYAASKEAQMSMIKNLAKQLAPSGITVNSVAPGVIDTPRNREVLADEQYRKAVLAKIHCGYIGAAEDLAGAVLLLCSEGGRYITGIDLLVDGGMHL